VETIFASIRFLCWTSRALLPLPGVVPILGFGRDTNQRKLHLVEGFRPTGTFDDMIKARFRGDLPREFGPTAFSKVVFGV
jgi:hypothetical protein